MRPDLQFIHTFIDRRYSCYGSITLTRIRRFPNFFAAAFAGIQTD